MTCSSRDFSWNWDAEKQAFNYTTHKISVKPRKVWVNWILGTFWYWNLFFNIMHIRTVKKVISIKLSANSVNSTSNFGNNQKISFSSRHIKMMINQNLKIPSTLEMLKSIRTIRSEWKWKSPLEKYCYMIGIGKPASGSYRQLYIF